MEGNSRRPRMLGRIMSRPTSPTRALSMPGKIFMLKILKSYSGTLPGCQKRTRSEPVTLSGVPV